MNSPEEIKLAFEILGISLIIVLGVIVFVGGRALMGFKLTDSGWGYTIGAIIGFLIAFTIGALFL